MVGAAKSYPNLKDSLLLSVLDLVNRSTLPTVPQEVEVGLGCGIPAIFIFYSIKFLDLLGLFAVQKTLASRETFDC